MSFPIVVAREIEEVIAEVSEEQVEALIAAINNTKAVYVCGVGRSLLMMKAFAMRLVHLGLTAYVVGETTTPAITPGDLLIAGSGSGQTRTTLAMVEAGRARQAKTCTITAHPDSPIAQMSHLVVEIPTPVTVSPSTVRKSRQPPGSLFEQCLLVLADTVVLMLKDKLGVTEDVMRARHTKLE